MKKSYAMILLMLVTFPGCERREAAPHPGGAEKSPAAGEKATSPVNVLSESGGMRVVPLDGVTRSEPAPEPSRATPPQISQGDPNLKPSPTVQPAGSLRANSTTTVQSPVSRATIRSQAMEEMMRQKAATSEGTK